MKINIEFVGQAEQHMNDLKRKIQVSSEIDVIRRALKCYYYLILERDKNSRLIIEDCDGKRKQIEWYSV